MLFTTNEEEKKNSAEMQNIFLSSRGKKNCSALSELGGKNKLKQNQPLLSEEFC